MTYLSINTAAANLEIALKVGDKVFVKADNNYKKASEIANHFVDELLSENNLTLGNLDFLSVVIGPGSFTGIRIGVSMTRIFGQFGNVPLVTVDSLEVLAYEALLENNVKNKHFENIITLADASNGFVYIAAYDASVKDAAIRFPILSPSVIKLNELNTFLSTIDEPHIIVAEKAVEALIDSPNIIIPKHNGQALLNASLVSYQKNGTIPFLQILPLYIRKSQAEEQTK